MRAAGTFKTSGSNGIAIAPANTAGRPRPAADQSAHLLLLPLRAADDQRRGAERLRRVHLGPVLHLPGLQRAAGWMHTSTGADDVDEFAETIVRKGDGSSIAMAARSGRSRSRRSPCPTARRRWHGRPRPSPSSGPTRAHRRAAEGGKWIAIGADEQADGGAGAVVRPHQDPRPGRVRRSANSPPTRPTTPCSPIPRARQLPTPQFMPRRDGRFDYGSGRWTAADPATEWKGLVPFEDVLM